MTELAFFIPVFNKSKTIKKTIELLIYTTKSLNISFEIIAIDDGSEDDSWNQLVDLKDNYLTQGIREISIYKNEKNIGFSKTYFRCVDVCQSRYGMYISADNDLHERCLRSLLQNLGSSELVIQACSNEETRPFLRRFISQNYTKILNSIHGLELKYYNGFNIYPVEFLKKQKDFQSSFAFQAELVIKALSVYSYKEVSIQCGYNDGETSAFKINNIVGVVKFIIQQLWIKKIG